MKKQIMDPEWTNDLEIRAYGLMRSGNHAIIEWVQNQHSNQITCFLNNVQHGDHDPYITCKRRVLTNINEPIGTEDLRRMKKRLLIYSYEDRDELEISGKTFLESVFQQDFEENRQYYFGASRVQLDMLIIRDPFNYLASRIKLLQVRGSLDGVSSLELIIKNWKLMAKEAIKLNQDPQPGKLVVSYNQWVTELAYRKDLSQKIMGEFNDASLKKVSDFGGGSSFRNPDKLTVIMVMARWKELFNISRYAQFGHYWRRFTAPDIERKVFDRWKYFAADENFQKMVLDRELIELSEKLFGEIPGTREFVNNM